MTGISMINNVFGYFSTSSTAAYYTEDPKSTLSTTLAARGTVSTNVGAALPDPYPLRAVALNVTVGGGTSGGWLTAYPDGSPVPGSSNLNWVTGAVVENSVVVQVNNGSVDLVSGSGSGGKVTVNADVVGYFVG